MSRRESSGTPPLGEERSLTDGGPPGLATALLRDLLEIVGRQPLPVGRMSRRAVADHVIPANRPRRRLSAPTRALSPRRSSPGSQLDCSSKGCEEGQQEGDQTGRTPGRHSRAVRWLSMLRSRDLISSNRIPPSRYDASMTR